ncbi:hypothetical protein ABW19_dt0204007 [Dactylella cylindrospora]|nr:hypothetical protein ABW19_dt0204007 [Dactylella cylindrospora]
MSRHASVGDDGGLHKNRFDTTFAPVRIRDLDNPEPSLRPLLGPPTPSTRERSYISPGDDEDPDEHRRQLVTEIAREATALVDVQNDASQATEATHPGVVTRRWPTRDVTNENIDDCYVDFILCCNPAVPDSCDTAELRRAFRTPPKCDGATFSTFRLFELIKRFEEGDIKTWIQLVTELGVERKNDQSSQKVQQYAVRLKRWMHAMHVDAFFEYCLSRLHVYYTDIPLAISNIDEDLRDGVPIEEDLALRALIPEYRPKRGRRKIERNTIDSSYLSLEPPERRPRPLLLPGTLPNIMAHDGTSILNYDDNSNPFAREDRSRDQESNNPESRIWPDIRMPNPQPLFPSLSSQVLDAIFPGGQQFRWRASQTLNSRHNGIQRVRSAPIQQFPSFKRARRSHGPAVSSAWPSSGTSRGGKPRGRPVGNRGAAETSYSTFSASPADLEAELSDADIAASLAPELTSTPAAIEEQLHFSSDAHQTILPPIVHALADALADPTYDHNVEIPPLLERDGMRDDLHETTLNPYSSLERPEMIKEQFATQLTFLATPHENINDNLARTLANTLVDSVTQYSNARGTGEAALRYLSMLLGLDALEVHDLVVMKSSNKSGPVSDVQQLRTEMSMFERYRGTDNEEHNINDLINDDAASSPQTIQGAADQEVEELDISATSEKYDISWKIKLGPIEASLTASVTPTENHSQPPASRDEQRLRDEVDMLFSDMETGNPSPGSYPGSASDPMLNDDMEPTTLESAVYWRSKYLETREKLRKTEEDLQRLKHDLVARVMA